MKVTCTENTFGGELSGRKPLEVGKFVLDEIGKPYLQPFASSPARIGVPQKSQTISLQTATYWVRPWWPAQLKPFLSRPALPAIIAFHSPNEICPETTAPKECRKTRHAYGAGCQ